MILRPRKEGGIQISWEAKHSLLGIGGKRASGGGRSGGGNETTFGEKWALQYEGMWMKWDRM